MPASASAPANVSNSICIEVDCFSSDESAAASATVVGCGAGLLCAVAAGSAEARRGLLAALVASDDSGQREATCDCDAVASGAIARGLF